MSIHASHAVAHNFGKNKKNVRNGGTGISSFLTSQEVGIDL